MNHSTRSTAAFTLTEMLVSMGILIMALALAMTGYLYLWSESGKKVVQDELDVAVQVAMEQIKRDLRLSALERIYYYPAGPGPYTAISMPLARDDDGDGAVDIDANTGKIIWDRTLIYHVWSGYPTQLRRTTFDPRDNSLTATQMQSQLNSVVAVGNGSATYGSTNTTTTVVFQNLFSWSILPQSSTYDAYESTLSRDLNVSLGTAVISNGAHTLQFIVRGKHTSSSGYAVGLDSLFMSPSHSTREAEAQLPVAVASGATAVVQYMSQGSWSGNHQLSFPATAIGNSFTLRLNNDRWEETNFRATGELHDNTTVLFDTSLSPSNFVVLLDGNRTNWLAATQTGDTNGLSSSASDAIKGYAVRAVLRGANIDEGSWINADGGRCQVRFQAGIAGLRIEDAFIAEMVNVDSNSMDAVASTMTRLTFAGSESVSIATGASVWSDMATFPISREKSYLVSYLIGNGVGNGTARYWKETTAPTAIGSYLITGASSPTETTISTATWSSRTDVIATNEVYACGELFATYPTNGLYTSAIFDTQLTAPGYSNMTWTSVAPTGTLVRMRVRSGNSNDLADASAWSAISPMSASGTINPGNMRYVQFQAQLLPNSTGTSTPKLLDNAIGWRGEARAVDIGGTFTKGPGYGIFELLVDGQSLKRGIVVNLEIFDYVRSHGTSNRITSALSAEVTPLNSRR